MPTNRAQHATAPQADVGSACLPDALGDGGSGDAWRRRLVPRRESSAPRWIIAAAVLALVGAASAQTGEWADVPPPPEMAEDAPPPVLDERARQLQMLEEADITLIERPDGIIREYRIGGRLFMVEVVPRFGPRYYLIDTNGDGMLDTQRRGLGPDFVPPQWILFQW
jgi:hypothetical protein